MSMMLECALSYPGYETRLRMERKARKARIAAAAVYDDGIDLKRKPEEKWIAPVIEAAAPLIPTAPVVWLVDECAAWMAAEYLVNDQFYQLPLHAAGRRPRVEEIQRVVARQYNVSRIDILSHRRTANVVRPRQVAMYISKMLTLRSLPDIGRRFGGRDHTTALHAVRKIAALRLTDESVASAISDIAAILSQAGMDVEPLGIAAQ